MGGLNKVGRERIYLRLRHRHSMLTVLAVAGAGLLSVSSGLQAASSVEETGDVGQETSKGASSTLATVEVKGSRITEVDEAKAQLRKIPGAVGVVDNKQVERGRASNLEDILALQPGVFAQSTSGTSANKVSIRGSGLNSFYGGYSQGIKYMYDGIPFTGAGGTQEDLLNGSAVDHTEILYGANAFAYTALALGGAINFVTHTGYTSPGNYARFEVGSFGYSKEQLSTGGVVDDTDYYVSVLHNQRDGYQDDSATHGKDLVMNIGHVFNPKLETRFFIRYRAEDYQNASTLTKEQIKHDPTANNYRWIRKKQGTTLVGSTTTYTFDDDAQLEVGLGYNNYPLYTGIKQFDAEEWYKSTDLTETLRYLRKGDTFLGMRTDTTFSFSNTDLLPGDNRVRNYATESVHKYDLRFNYTGSRDTVFALGNDLQVADKLWLTTGVSWINVDRDIRTTYNEHVNTTNFPNDVKYDDWSVAPRIGFRYEFTPEMQLFGNVSRSVDPPVTWYYRGRQGDNFFLKPLYSQKGNTVELGVRGSAGIFDGSLTVYRSWIKGELLSAVVIPATDTTAEVRDNVNGSPTIHQGVEAGLATQLWQGAAGDSVSLRQAYTFNDFYYRHDEVFGDNQLPSMPRHVYQAELQYQQPSGFYASVNVRSVSSYYVDFANTLRAPSYTIFGAKVGYDSPHQGWGVFLDARNLADKNYVTAANSSYDAHGQDAANFYVGDGFGVTTGVSYRF